MVPAASNDGSATSRPPRQEQSRRQFVENLRRAAAVPVVVGLSLSWTTSAGATY